MADKPLFNLYIKGRWRLAYDSNQWVLQKRAGSPGRNRYGIRESGWRGVSFVGGRKTTLERSLPGQYSDLFKSENRLE